MNRFHWALLSLCLVSGTAAATTEPGLDLDATASPAGGTIVNEEIVFHFQTLDLRPGEPWIVDDTITISLDTLSPPINVRGLAYVDTGTTGQANDVVTTIYGQAYTPIGTGLETTGFTPSSPEVSFSGETIIGNLSGTQYAFSWASGPVPLSDLSSLPQLQGLDLSPFTGDTSSEVYAFQTDVPASDLAAPVPEPLTMFAVGMGIAGLGGYIRRRAAAK
jgi:hypothetical protein